MRGCTCLVAYGTALRTCVPRHACCYQWFCLKPKCPSCRHLSQFLVTRTITPHWFGAAVLLARHPPPLLPDRTGLSAAMAPTLRPAPAALPLAFCYRPLPLGAGGGLHVHEGLLPSRARGAVFDLDGTLLDTNERWVRLGMGMGAALQRRKWSEGTWGLHSMQRRQSWGREARAAGHARACAWRATRGQVVLTADKQGPGLGAGVALQRYRRGSWHEDGTS